MGTKFQFCKTKRILKEDGAGSRTKVGMSLIPLNFILKMVKIVLCSVYFATI